LLALWVVGVSVSDETLSKPKPSEMHWLEAAS